MELASPTAEEFNFIFDSWAKSFRSSPWAGCIRNVDYDEVSRKTMSEIIDRGARVVVAYSVLPTGERRIAGYSVSDPKRKILFYIYCKRDFRGMGVGRQLRRDVVVDADLPTWIYTHRTKASDRFLTVDGQRMKWNPVPARTKD